MPSSIKSTVKSQEVVTSKFLLALYSFLSIYHNLFCLYARMASVFELILRFLNMKKMKIPKVSLKGFLLPIMLLSLKTSEAQSKYILRSSNFLIFRFLRSFLFICFKYATE